jgi:hypothetical protein
VKGEILQYCHKESHRPFTLNKEYLKRKEDNLAAYALLRHRNTSPDPPFTSSSSSTFRLQDGNFSRAYAATEENLVTVLSAYGIRLSSLTQLARIHADDFDAELDVIAHVAAYFDIAATRTIDNIPQLFESGFASKFVLRLEEELATKLKLVGEGSLERCRMYVRDEPDIQVKRDRLVREQRILEDALATIDRFYDI